MSDWQPASETVRICGHQPPRILFFMLSGTIANGLQLALDRATLLVLPNPQDWWVPTACWAISYSASVPFRFVLHSLLVFGPHSEPICFVISKAALAYFSTIIVSSLANLAFVTFLDLSHYWALLATASISVIFSYVAFSLVWSYSALELLCLSQRQDSDANEIVKTKRRQYQPVLSEDVDSTSECYEGTDRCSVNGFETPPRLPHRSVGALASRESLSGLTPLVSGDEEGVV